MNDTPNFDSPDALDDACISELSVLFLNNETVIVHMTPMQAWTVLCAVQLATRHPDAYKEPTLHVAAKAVQDIASQVAGTPALREIVRRGWSREYSS